MTIKVNQITEISLKDTKTWGHAIQLGNGLILTDKIDDIVLSQRIIRLDFILMALCRKGEAQYRISDRTRFPDSPSPPPPGRP